MLSAVARQAGGAPTDLLQVAIDLHVAFPELASVELQPGGIVTDIVPRLGNQQAIGFNVLKDPVLPRGCDGGPSKRCHCRCGTIKTSSR